MNTSYQGQIDLDALQAELTAALGTSQGWRLQGEDAKALDGTMEKAVRFIVTELGAVFDPALVASIIQAHIANGPARVTNRAILAQIDALESPAVLTPRRIREALAGTEQQVLQADGVTKLGWMKDHDNQVAELRAALLKDANGKVIL